MSFTIKDSITKAYTDGYNSFLSARSGGIFDASVCLNSYQADAFLNQLQRPQETDTEFRKLYREVYNLHLCNLDNGTDEAVWRDAYQKALDLYNRYSNAAELLTAMYMNLYQLEQDATVSN